MISRYIEKYSVIISQNLGDVYIKFPQTENEITNTKMAFEHKFDLPGVVGVVDGTQVALSAVPNAIEIPFVNRKQFHSINAQIICDARLYITNINPGSTHDSYIFRTSRVNTFLEQYFGAHQDEWTWLLGIFLLNVYLKHAMYDFFVHFFSRRFCI